MQKFLSKYALAAHLAMLAVAPLFLFPFFDSRETSKVLLWLSFLSFFWIFLEPSRRVDEFLYNARKRVYKAIFSDPLFWVLSIFLVMAFISWVNGGVRLEYGFVDKDWQWVVSRPRLAWLPGSDTVSGFALFSQFAALTVIVLACRHAMGKSARIMFVFLTALFAAAAAVAAVLSTLSGSGAAYDMAVSGQSVNSYAGSAFGLFFLAACVSFSGMYERGWNRAMILFSFAAGAVFTGLWYFAPPAVTIFYSLIGFVLLLVSLVYVAVHKGSLPFFKLLVALLVAAAIPAAVINFVAPDELREAKLGVLAMEFFPAGYAESRAMYSAMASDVWKSGNVWLGGGLGSLPLSIKLDLPESSWVDFIPNGWWQLLAERGLNGIVMIALPFCLMAYTFVSRIFRSQFKRSVWPLTVFGVLAPVAALTEGFFNASLFRPEILVAAGAFLSIAAASLPLRRNAPETDKK